jgi:hypothetical protein
MVGRKAGWATAWQPSPTGKMVCAAAATRARRRDGVLAGGSAVARCCRRAPVGSQGGAGQGGEGRGAPKRWVDGEAAQTALVGGVQWWQGRFGGRR